MQRHTTRSPELGDAGRFVVDAKADIVIIITIARLYSEFHGSNTLKQVGTGMTKDWVKLRNAENAILEKQTYF